MTDETNGRNPDPSGDATIATLHVQDFDVRSSPRDITVTFRGEENASTGQPTVVRVEIASADVESLLGVLRSEVTRSRRPQNESETSPAGVRHAGPGSDRAGYPRHPGIHYTELGWTREEFEEAAEDMSDMKDIWDHDELDVYNDLLKR